MDRVLRETVIEAVASSKRKTVNTQTLLEILRHRVPDVGDFEREKRLLDILKDLQNDNLLRLPKARNCWNPQTGLPRFITAVRQEADAARKRNKMDLEALRHATVWEPTRMAAFAHTLRRRAELEMAEKVNRYLLDRKPDVPSIPHRERALMIFGSEKALDGYLRKGLFGGRITLKDLDCFYCPEPLPFRALSMDRREIAGKPLLVVENANTYWSCCQANAEMKRFAAVVYGQGFKVMAGAAQRANDGLAEIEDQLDATGIAYFGDLDPAGIAIPMYMNTFRQANRLRPLVAECSLYQALLEKDRSVPAKQSEKEKHNPELARQWLGDELASVYLQRAPGVRWPQEGLTAADIVAALSI
jgi:hypothetical protein